MTLQLGLETLWQDHQRTQIIIHDTDIQTFLSLADQNFLHSIPHLTLADNEIFKEDKGLGLLHILEHGSIHVLTQFKIGHICIAMAGIGALTGNVVRNPLDLLCDGKTLLRVADSLKLLLNAGF